MKVYFTKFRIVILALFPIAILLWFLAKANPEWIEFNYSRSLYIYYTEPFAWLSTLIKLPLADAYFIYCGALFLIVPAYCFIRFKQQGKLPVFVHMCILGVVTLLWNIYLGFPFFINVNRLPTAENFEVTTPLSQAQKIETLQHIALEAEALQTKFNLDEHGCTDFELSFEEMDLVVQAAQIEALDGNGFLTVKSAKTRPYQFSEFWEALGPSGVYVPALAHPTVSLMVHPLIIPFVMGHERGHLNGFTAEAAATMAAYKTGFDSSSDIMRYSALLDALMSFKYTDGLSEQVLKDYQCVASFDDHIKPFAFRKTFWQYYDFFLKAQGQVKGKASYHYGDELGLRYYYKKLNKNPVASNSAV